jgi:hypothetical protein
MKTFHHGILIGAFALSACTFTTLADYPSTVLGDGPSAYWRLNDSAQTPTPYPGTNLGSLGASGNGVYSGVFTRPAAGAIEGDSAVAFLNPSLGTGFTGSMNVPNNTALNPSGGFTIEFWAKPSNNTASLLSPVNSMSFVSGRAGYLFYQNAATWQMRIGVTTSTTASILNGGTVTPNEWQHVVGVYSGGAAGIMTLYVDGIQVGTASASYEVNTDAPFCIGATSAPNRSFDGTVDEVAFYSAVLSADTIAAHYAARTTNAANYASQVLSASPIGYWRLNEPADASPVAANSGSLGASANGSYAYWSENTADLRTPAYPGFAADNTVLQPSGTNGIVRAPALNLNANNVTFECWIKRNGSQTSYAGVLFHRGSAGGTATGIDFKDTTDNLGYHWNDQGNTYGWVSGLVPPDGMWTYVALAVTPSKATMYMYDGTTWSSAVNEVDHPPQAFADITRIGADSDGSRFFNGLIDEAAIYAKTLTEGQLRTHALAGFGDPSKNQPMFVTDPPTLEPEGTIYTTTSFTLTADVYGEPPLSFQWQREGTDIPGATSYTYTKTATAADTGNYTVVVSNAYGSVTSSAIGVTINSAVPPTITSQPVTRLVYAGYTAQFSALAEGTTPMSYQWKHAGTNLPGATNATLVLANCGAAQAGTYAVGITNVAGGVLSSSATLYLTTPVPGSFEEKVVTNGPVSYWRLGETSGTVAFDYVGGNDGTYNSVSQGQPGAVLGDSNGAAGFDGASSYITTGRGLLNNRAQFTVMGWLKRGATHSSRGGYFGQNDLLEFGDASSGASIEAWVNAAGSNLVTPWPWPDDQWGFIVLTGDGSVNTLYIDGQAVATLSSTVSSYGTNAFSFNIGGGGIFNNPAVNMDYFNGYIDEVALYAKPLSAETVATLYSAGLYGKTTPPFITSSPASQTAVAARTAVLSGGANGSLPIAYQWKKDGVNVPGATAATLSLPNVYFTDAGSYVLWVTNAAGFTNSAAAVLTVMPEPTFANLTNDLVLHMRFDGDYLDTSGRGNNASEVGTPTFLPGKVGQGIHIATTKGDNYLVVSDMTGTDFAFEETTSFTVSFWIKYTVGFNDVPIIGNAVNSTWQLGWVFTDSATAGKIEWSLASTANTGTYLRDPVPGCPTINDGQWHNVVGVVDRTAKLASVYVDGAFAGSWSIDGLGSLNPGNSITIGQDPTGNYGAATFDLDDLGIWRRALTDYEAASIYGAADTSGNSFDVYGPTKLAIKQVEGNLDVNWQAGTLLQATSPSGPWTAVPGAVAPFYRTTATGSTVFFRVQQ